MPNIREYRNPISDLQPNERGASAAIRAGNAAAQAAQAQAQAAETWGAAIGKGIKDLGETYVKRRTAQQLSQGMRTYAEILDNTTTAWNNTIKEADPNDPAVADRFREEQLEPILKAWESSFDTEEGKTWAATRVAQARQHFFEKTAADQSTMAGIAAFQNVQQTVSVASNMVMNDPTTTDTALGMVDTLIETLIASSPNMSASDAARLKTEFRTDARKEIVRSGFIGMARANPDEAQRALASGYGQTELDGTDRDQLYGFAASIKNAQEADARAAEAERARTLKREVDAYRAEVYARGIQPDGSWLPPRGYAQALQDAALKAGGHYTAEELRSDLAASEHAIDLHNSRKLQMDDPTTYERFLSNLAGNDKTAINKAYADGLLSTHSWSFFLKAVDEGQNSPGRTALNRQMNTFFAGLKSSVTKSNPMAMQIFPEQDQKWYEFQAMVMRTVDWAVKTQGMTPEQAAFDYLDPRGPKYLGSLIPRYQLSGADLDAASLRMENAPVVPTTNLAAPPARLPGETPAQYLKRTGK